MGVDDLPELPAEVLGQLVSRPTRDRPDGATDDLWARNAVPIGEQHAALVALAGFVRSHPRWLLSEEGLAHFLEAAASNGTLERDASRRPYGPRDFATIARSIAAHPVGEPDFEIVQPPLASISGEETFVGPTVRWWIPDFVPRGELVMMYGPKAAGKSTTASWLAALVTQRGGRFLHIGVEEPWQRFLGRSVLCGAVRSRLRFLMSPSSVRTPSTVDLLKAYIEQERIDFVYFDSIFSHFDGGDRGLESTRARTSLSPLAEMAQSTGATVMGVFHDRRADGDYMGSTEMVNVARVVLRISRAQGAASKLHVRLTNFNTPDYALRLDAVEMPFADPATGEVQMIEQRDGTIGPMNVRVVREAVEVPEGVSDATTSDIERPRNQAALDAI